MKKNARKSKRLTRKTCVELGKKLFSAATTAIQQVLKEEGQDGNVMVRVEVPSAYAAGNGLESTVTVYSERHIVVVRPSLRAKGGLAGFAGR